MRTTLWISCAIVATGATFIGCSKAVVPSNGSPAVVVVADRQPGPPDHAPAWGHRRGTGAHVVLVYNSELRVYAVKNHPHCYYSAGQYFRPTHQGWEWAAGVAGPWRVVKGKRDIPPRLRHMHLSAND